jgi:hypothetical protein
VFVCYDVQIERQEMPTLNLDIVDSVPFVPYAIPSR